MTTKTALATVLTWAAVFACVGSATGAMLGTVVPEYYRSLFHGGQSPNFDPVQVGVGLGATQGAASGIAVSILVVALFAWRDSRFTRAAHDRDISKTASRSRTWFVHVCWGAVTAISVLIISSTTFIAGGIVGQQQLYQVWTERKLDRIATILQSDDFDGVKADYSSAAQVYLSGTIKDVAARDALLENLVAAFGTEEADEMMWQVNVAR